MDGSKALSGLLNGIARRLYYGDDNITDQFLKDELYPDMKENEFQTLLTKSTSMLKSIASADMDPNQLQAFLTSQTRKKDSGITEEQAAVYQKFWKTHQNRIHESLVSRSKWNNGLKSCSWRIDIQSRAKNVEQMNTASAIVELELENNQQNNEESAEVVRFEVDEKAMKSMLKSLKDIEDQISSHSQ